MTDMKFSLASPETVTITVQTIDKLLRAGDGDAALLYLYVLKTHGHSTPDEAAAALDRTKGSIASAMAVLSRLGLIKLDYGEAGPPPEMQRDAVPEPSPDEVRRYTLEEMKRELMDGSPFSAVVDETQRSLGKILSPDELLRLFGIYDALRLPPEVIMLLITHCIAESRRSDGGRAPSLRYIEKAAYTWEREGVLTLDKAERYIKDLDIRRSVSGEIKNALQIRDREFSATEKKYVDGWIEMGFAADAVAVAYDITVVYTGKLTWKYIDGIMKNWHNRGIHTRQEIADKDKLPGAKGGSGGAKTAGQKFGAPDQAELERMKRVLEKIKEEE